MTEPPGQLPEVRAVVLRRLLLWSGASVLAGMALILAGGTFWRGFGVQAAAWGGIAAAVALGGLAWLRNPAVRSRGIPGLLQRCAGPATPALLAGLELLLSTGLSLLLIMGLGHPSWRGHAWGIAIQGVALWLLDLAHSRLRPAEMPPAAWMGVDGPEHESFLWPGGRPAALLVHGFPDTPRGMQPLGRALHAAGWTVRGLLLPGFGPQIETLPQRRWQEWQAAVLAALAALRAEHSPILLVGYSLGGALALGAAAAAPPDGLVLLAPFIWPWPRWQRALARWLRPFLLPYVRPLRWVSLDDPRIRAGVAGLFPHVDLSDPALRKRVRDVAIPLALFEQVRGASQHGYEQAARVAAPALIVQGRHDNVARPARTRLLLPRLPGARYVEVEADHEVLSPAIPAWAEIVRAVSEFAAERAGPPRSE